MLFNETAELAICMAASGIWSKEGPAAVLHVDPMDLVDETRRDILRSSQEIWKACGVVDETAIRGSLTQKGYEVDRALFEINHGIGAHRRETLPGMIDTVRKLARIRRALKHSLAAQAAIDAEDMDAAEESFGKIARTMVEGRQRRDAKRLSVIAKDLIDQIHSPATDRGTGMSTGLYAWDRGSLGLLGLHRTHLTVLAARPAMGKTALALNIAWNVAAHGTPVLFSCGEMSAVELGERLLSHISQVDYSRIRTGRLDADAHARLADATRAMADAPLHIWDAGRVTAPDLLAQTRLVSAQEGKPVGLLVVDYLQRMGCEQRYREPRHRVAHNAEALKSMAQDENMCVLALAQLNRGLESRTDRRPLMADLREAGEIEQEANEVIALYRHHVYFEDAPPHAAELIVRKARGARTGRMDLRWDGSTMTFGDA